MNSSGSFLVLKIIPEGDLIFGECTGISIS